MNTRFKFLVVPLLATLAFLLIGIPCHAEKAPSLSDPDLALQQLKKKVAAYQPNPKYRDDTFIKICVEEAIAGACEGNQGVGACLVKDGKVIIRGHNQIYHPYRRSDLHAEMNVMTIFEQKHRNATGLDKYTLYTSLESCPMCAVRLIGAKVGQILHAAANKGRCEKIDQLPPGWREQALHQVFAHADCSPELATLSLEAWHISKQLIARDSLSPDRPPRVD